MKFKKSDAFRSVRNRAIKKKLRNEVKKVSNQIQEAQTTLNKLIKLINRL